METNLVSGRKLRDMLRKVKNAESMVTAMEAHLEQFQRCITKLTELANSEENVAEQLGVLLADVKAKEAAFKVDESAAKAMTKQIGKKTEPEGDGENVKKEKDD